MAVKFAGRANQDGKDKLIIGFKSFDATVAS